MARAKPRPASTASSALAAFLHCRARARPLLHRRGRRRSHHVPLPPPPHYFTATDGRASFKDIGKALLSHRRLHPRHPACVATPAPTESPPPSPSCRHGSLASVAMASSPFPSVGQHLEALRRRPLCFPDDRLRVLLVVQMNQIRATPPQMRSAAHLQVPNTAATGEIKVSGTLLRPPNSTAIDEIKVCSASPGRVLAFFHFDPGCGFVCAGEEGSAAQLDSILKESSVMMLSMEYTQHQHV